MKAETKAKRRVTLSICGLGMLDESEVPSVKGAEVVPVEIPAPKPAAPALVEANADGEPMADESQMLRISTLAMSKDTGLGWAKPRAVSWLKKRFGVESRDKLTYAQAEDAIDLLETRRDDGDEAYYNLIGLFQGEGRVLAGDE